MRDSHPTPSWWRAWLHEQRRKGFPALAGSEGTLQLTLSDALLNELVAARLPAAWPITELTVQALDGHEVAIRARPRSAWLPPVQARLAIEQRPATPAAPFLRARFTSSLGRLAGLAIGAAAIPHWIHVAGDSVTVDVAALAAHVGMPDLLRTVRTIIVGTERGRVVLTTALAVEGATASRSILD